MIRIDQLDEKSLVRFHARKSSRFWSAFGFMLDAALGWEPDGWSLDCYLNVPREELGLETGVQPGDVDVLLVPRFDDDVFAERAIAIEVKRYFLSAKNRHRSPSSFGTTQANGLINDGFPLVGLAHLIVVEESPQDEWIEIPLLKSSYMEGEDRYEGYTLHDPAATTAAFRMEGRLKKLDLHDKIGFHVQALCLNNTCTKIVGTSLCFHRMPKKNPRRCVKLVERLKVFSHLPDCVFELRQHDSSVINRAMGKLDCEDDTSPSSTK